MFPDRFGEGTEDNPFFCKRFPEGCSDRYGIKNGVNCNNSGKSFPFLQRDTEFLKSLGKGGIDFLRSIFILFRGRIIDNILEINFGHIQMGP